MNEINYTQLYNTPTFIIPTIYFGIQGFTYNAGYVIRTLLRVSLYMW